MNCMKINMLHEIKSCHKFIFFLLKRAAIVQIPKTPPTYTKDALLERRRLFDRNEGEVNKIN